MSAPVTIVIPCCNHAQFVADAIESALRQEPPPAQIVVIDDGSDDDPEKALSQFPQAQLFKTDGLGRSAARNLGLQHATQQYVICLDADDVLVPGAIASHLECFARHPLCGFVYGAFQFADADLNPIGEVHFTPIGGDAVRQLERRNYPNTPGAVMFDRSRLLAVGGFAPDLDRAEDYELYLRLSRKFPLMWHDDLVVLYRRHEDNTSRDVLQMLDGHLTAVDRTLSGSPERRLAARRHAYVAYAERAWGGYEAGPSEALAVVRNLFSQAPVATVRGLTRGLALKLLPRGAKLFLKERLKRWHMARGRRVSFGDIDRSTPVDSYYGMNRGTPVDRPIIEQFLLRNAASITGEVMEVGNDAYSRKFGEGISRQYVLNGTCEGVNRISGDLCDPAVLPKEAFDCIILTQTLQFVSDPAEALKNCNAALKPGGTLLMSVPVLSPLIDEQWQFRWLFTGPFVHELLTVAFPASEKEVHSIGNCYAATCIINGVPMEEADQTKLVPVDPERPILVLAKVTKPQA